MYTSLNDKSCQYTLAQDKQHFSQRKHIFVPFQALTMKVYVCVMKACWPGHKEIMIQATYLRFLGIAVITFPFSKCLNNYDDTSTFGLSNALSESKAQK